MSTSSVPPDSHYPFLTAADGDELRRLVHRSFAAHGADVLIHGGDVGAGEGWLFHLDNLARSYAQEPDPRTRIRHVDAFVRSMLDSMAATGPAGGLEGEEIMARLLIRLLPEENLAETEPAGIETRPFLEGVIQVLVVDHPDRVEFVGPELLERLGGWGTVHARALENLRALRLDGPVERLGSTESGAVLDTIVDDSFYTASKALLAPEFVEAASGGPIGEGGFFFTIPDRHQFAYCLLQDSTAMTSLPPMAGFAYRGWAENPGPVSPLIYWHDGQRIHDVAMVDPAKERPGVIQQLGDLQLNLPEALQETLHRLRA